MPAKIVKFRSSSGRKVEVKSIRLANGNLLILKRPAPDQRHEWTEVAPGTSDYKRWAGVMVDEPDPRGAA